MFSSSFVSLDVVKIAAVFAASRLIIIKGLFVGLILVSVNVMAGSCTDIAEFDEELSKIYVVCPELPDFSAPQLADTVYTILTAEELVPDEYTIDFVISDKYLSKESLTGDSYVGFFYTHNSEIVIWPKRPDKKRIVQLSPFWQ